MNSRLVSWTVHSLYLLLIATLAFAVLRTQLRNGEFALFQSLETTLPVARRQIEKINRLYLKAIIEQVLNNVAHSGLIFDVFRLIGQSDILCPTIGQTFTTTVFLSSSSPSFYLNEASDKVWVNGKQATIRENTARFSTVFHQAGPQPLHIRVEKLDILKDSVRVYEKTYTVNVWR